MLIGRPRLSEPGRRRRKAMADDDEFEGKRLGGHSVPDVEGKGSHE